MKYGFDLPAGISYIPLIHNIKEWGKFVTIIVQGTVHIVGNSNKSHIFLSKQHFCIKAYFKVITPDTAHIIYNNVSYSAIFNIRKHTLPVRSVKIGT